MFGDSRALFTDSNAIFSSNFSPKGVEQEVVEEEDLFSRTKMNFDMNSIIQDNFNNKSLDFNSESFKVLDDDGDGNDKGLSNGFGLSSQLLSQFPRQSSNLVGGLENNSGLFRTGSSMGMDNQVKVSSGLMRQNSSPAGFFSHITPQSGTLQVLLFIFKNLDTLTHSSCLLQGSNPLKICRGSEGDIVRPKTH